MTARRSVSLKTFGLALLVVPTLGACHHNARYDTIHYGAGDAVRANLMRETINPTKGSMYDVSGLGKDGAQIPSQEEATSAP